jgi:divalent metal cation (Fe/Co/Zn/Cd) transporter
LITGHSADPGLVADIGAFLAARAEVAEVLSLLTLQMGDGVMVAVKARMDAADAGALVDAINRVEAALRQAFPEVRWMFFEPDHVE